MSFPPDQPLDVAIVGGGVSGAYCAWRLIEQHPRARLGLFEGGDRIGGRLISVRPPGMQAQVAELGGMFIPSAHTSTIGLAEQLGLSADHIDRLDLSRAYLRGRLLDAAALLDPQQVPYRLSVGEQGRRSEALIDYALTRLIPELKGAAGPARLQILEQARVDGRGLADWGFWNLLVHGLSDDGYNYARDGNGDDYLVANWNALDIARQYYQIAASSYLVHIREGYDAIPRELASRFAAGGGQVYLRHRLVRLDRAELPDGTLGLRLDLLPNNKGWEPPGRRRVQRVYARKLILAMPRRSLELIEASGPLLRPANRQVRQLIEAVTPLPMFKLFLCYERAWWQDLGIESGFSLTDMPVRVCLYWGEDGPTRRGLLLASLSDMLAMNFWAGLRDQRNLPLFRPRRRDRPAPPAGPPVWADHGCLPTAAMVAEAQRQLALIHPQLEIPQPYAALYRDWGDDPFGGAGNFWNPHLDSADYARRMLQPQADLPVYICGEAYSRTQGWVEGALETAEELMARHFGLPTPAWLSAARQAGQ